MSRLLRTWFAHRTVNSKNSSAVIDPLGVDLISAFSQRDLHQRDHVHNCDDFYMSCADTAPAWAQLKKTTSLKAARLTATTQKNFTYYIYICIINACIYIYIYILCIYIQMILSVESARALRDIYRQATG